MPWLPWLPRGTDRTLQVSAVLSCVSTQNFPGTKELQGSSTEVRRPAKRRQTGQLACGSFYTKCFINKVFEQAACGVRLGNATRCSEMESALGNRRSETQTLSQQMDFTSSPMKCCNSTNQKCSALQALLLLWLLLLWL